MEKILLGLDGSKNSFKALKEAITLAKLFNAKLHTISVEELPHFPETIDEFQEEKEFVDSKFNSIIFKAKEIAEESNFPIEPHILAGHEVRTIVEFIKKNKFDLLVVGFVGISAIYERIMGSTSSSLVRLAPCSVLIIK